MIHHANPATMKLIIDQFLSTSHIQNIYPYSIVSLVYITYFQCNFVLYGYNIFLYVLKKVWPILNFMEFDLGSGRTLAACLTHLASFLHYASGYKYRKHTHWQLLKPAYNFFFGNEDKFLLFFLESAITTPFLAEKFQETRKMIYSLVNIKALSFPKIAWERKDMYI